MKELQLLKPDKSIVIPGERKQRRLAGTLRKIKGLTLYEYEVATNTLRPVEFDEIVRTVRNPANDRQHGIAQIGYQQTKYGRLDIWGILNTPTNVSRLTIKPGCSYIQALNEKVARRKLGVN